MITINPLSTDILTYVPKYDGQLLETGPDSYDCVIFVGDAELLRADPEYWNAELKSIDVPIGASDVVTALIHQTLVLTFTWTYDGQTFRDVEQVLVVDPTYGELLTILRNRFPQAGVTDQDLSLRLSMALSTVNGYLGTNFDFASNPPTSEYYKLILLVVFRDFATEAMVGAASQIVSWRDEEKSVTRKGADGYSAAINGYQQQINAELIHFGTPKNRSGGVIPYKSSDVLEG